MPYRPSRDVSDSKRGSASLVLRFVARYVAPHRGKVLFCIVLVSLNSSAVYLQAYYGRIVVDDILRVRSSEEVKRTDRHADRPLGDRREAPGAPRAQRGAASEAARLPDPRVPTAAGARLLGIFLLYLATIVTLNLANRGVRRIQFRLSESITGHLREDIHRKILSLSASYHQAHQPGRLMARILSDVNVVQKHLMQLLVNSSAHVIMFLIGVGILVALEWRVALMVVLAMIPYILLVSNVRGKIRRVNREVRHTNSCMWSLVSQKLDAIRAILSYNRERNEHLSFHRLSACLLRDTLKQQRLSAGMGRGAQVITMLTTNGIFLFCTVQVLNGRMSLGKMMFIYGSAANLFTPIILLTQVVTQFSMLLVVLHRLSRVFETPVEISDAPNAVPFPAPIEGGIQVHNLWFSYSEDGPYVLRDINVKIAPERWLCIMGPSGSGKTTLLQLLARIYDPVKGDVTVDGISLGSIRIRSLRRHVALVPQEPQIISGTLRDNITYGNVDASPTQIMAAARAADCHEFIMELPAKYETIIGEKGASLSGGQKQRISIARALLTDPEVLLLDDCTSALDAATEQRIQETLARLLVGKTAVIVSQRVSMAMRCRQIVVLENGVITERGPHASLVEGDGYYARLYRQQTQ